MNLKKTLKTIPGLAIIVLLLYGCGVSATPQPMPQPTPTPPMTGVSGRVYYANSDQPVAEVTILLNDPQLGDAKNSDLTVSKTKTDTQGQYSFTDIKPGTYVITFKYVTESSIASIDASQDVAAFMKSFIGKSQDGSTILYILEPQVEVKPGEITKVDFILH